MGKRWFVDINRRSVRRAEGPGSGMGLYERASGEVLLNAPTARDAAEKGARRALAEEALFVAFNVDDALAAKKDRFTILRDAIEAQASDPREALEDIEHLARALGNIPRGSVAYEVWIEAGCRALVLSRVPR
jgi:hypothetical protein